MHKLVTVFLVIFGSIVLNAPCHASEFHPMGYEAISMGGVGVATGNGSYAAYYNPALLSRYKHKLHIAVSPALAFREINIVDSIDTLSNIDIDETLEALSDLEFPDISSVSEGQSVTPAPSSQIDIIQSNVRAIKKELRALAEQNGLQIMPSASIGVQFGNFGFGAYGISEGTAYATIDSSKLDIIVGIDTDDDDIDDTWVEYNEANNTFSMSSESAFDSRSLQSAIEGESPSSYMNLTGLVYVEFPIAYGHQFSFPWGKLSCGGAFKIMTGQTFDEEIKIDTESGDINSDLENTAKSDTTWGVDVGVLYNPASLGNFTAGLVLKNLNSPGFSTISGKTLEVDPQIRAGVAYDFPGKKITCAMDLDLSENKTFIENYYAQYIGVGASFHPFSWLALRCGLMQNIKESDEGLILTAGIGTGVKWLQFDIAGQYSTESGQFDEQSIPRYGRIQFALISKWF